MVESIDDTVVVLPGNYTLLPKDGAELLHVIHMVCPMLPRGSLVRSRPASGDMAYKRTRTDGADVDRGIERPQRSAAFREQLLQRDNHCVISGRNNPLRACHIVAHSWWTRAENRRGALPQEVRDTIGALPEEIDNLQNGILLRTDLSIAFDNGQ